MMGSGPCDSVVVDDDAANIAARQHIVIGLVDVVEFVLGGHRLVEQKLALAVEAEPAMNIASGRVGVTSVIGASAVSTTAPPLRTMSSASPIMGPSRSPTVSKAESAITPRVRSPTKAVASVIDVVK